MSESAIPPAAQHGSDGGPSVPRWLPSAAFVIGVLFLCMIVALVVLIPKPSDVQFQVFKTVIALGGAAFSMGITGFLSIRLPLPRKGLIVAGGALGVFLVLYFYSPASKLVTPPAPSPPNDVSVRIESSGCVLRNMDPYRLSILRLQGTAEFVDFRGVALPNTRVKTEFDIPPGARVELGRAQAFEPDVMCKDLGNSLWQCSSPDRCLVLVRCDATIRRDGESRDWSMITKVGIADPIDNCHVRELYRDRQNHWNNSRAEEAETVAAHERPRWDALASAQRESTGTVWR